MIYICKWYPAKEKLKREKQSLFRMSDFSLPCHFPFISVVRISIHYKF